MIDRDFFKNLYAYSDGKIELRAIPGRKQVFVDIDGDMSGFCKANSKDHLYFGVATRDGKAGKKENIIHIPCVWSDVDFKETPREIVKDKLSKFPFKPSMIVHSGGGVHLYWILNEPAEQKHIAVVEDVNRRIAISLQGDQNACDAARILRIPGTTNHKYPKECKLLKVEDFLYNLDDFLEILPEMTTREAANTEQGRSEEWLTEAMMKGCGQGNRNATATKIAGYWINKLPPHDVEQILTLWNSNNTPPLSDSELQSTLKSIERYKPERDKQRVDISNVYTSERMVKEYLNYLESLKQNRFITGINEVDKRIRGVSGGEVLTIIARSGSFKTASLQNMLLKYRQHSSWGAVFFSIEMPVASVAERYFQILNDVTGKEVEETLNPKGADPRSYQEMITEFNRKMKNLFVIPTKVSLSDIPAYVKLIESEHNIKIGVVGIDYMGLMDGPGVNEYEIISRLSVGMKNMAKLMNLPVIVLSQVNRKGGAGGVEISLDMGRGSGAIEEGADFVLGMWQIDGTPIDVIGGEPKTPKELICRILKNRKGSAGSRWKLELTPETLTIGSGAEEYKPVKKKQRGFEGA